MSQKQKEPRKAAPALTSADKREIKAAIARAKKTDKKQRSAQDSIPYQRMYPDGVCRVTDTLYTKTLQFQDINYQLAQNDDKSAIFDGWCDLLNYFDSSVYVQFSFLNTTADLKELKEGIYIKPQDDEFDSIRIEYADMLREQFAKGNNGIIKTKFVTFGLDAANYKTAKYRLERIESDLWNAFKRLGVAVESLNGKDRLKLMHNIFHMDSAEHFSFDWKWLPKTGLSTKDFIAPSSFTFADARSYQSGEKYGAVSFLQILAPELSDRMLADFLELETSQLVTMHIQSIDQGKAIKTIKRKITDLDKMKIDEQMKAVRAGYDMDIIPSDLATYGGEAKKLLQDLQSRNERMFLLTFLILNTGENRQQLENNVFQAAGVAQKHNCQLIRLDFRQEQGLMSSLPLGLNLIEIKRAMTTSATAIFIPFMTQELRMDGQAIYYGINALSRNVIMADRKKLKSANALYLGSTGSGKSFAAKRELVNVFLTTRDRIIIIDPMGEYAPLTRRLGGQVIELAPDSPHHISPMDLRMNIHDEVSPLSLKADFLLSLCELVVGGSEGLQPIEKTVIDRCVRIIYREKALGLAPEKTILLQDLYEELLKQPEAEALRVATALELYCTGSLNLFNFPTNVNLNARVVCFDLKRLGDNLRKIATHITNDFASNVIDGNHREGIATWFYCDEFHVLLRDPLTASYFISVWKMLRKKGCVPTALTQNVKDLLGSREIENILENSDFIYMLNQAAGDREILAKRLNISPGQLSYVTNSGEGEGLMFYGNIILPFTDKFPKDTELYRIMTTKPQELIRQ